VTTLIVPIDVAALCVGKPDVTGEDPGGIAGILAPMADFAVLPYAAGGTVHNRGPYLSAEVMANSAAFTGAVPLLQGIHLHWALPAGLAHGVQGTDGKQEFPAVPERWLVTRIVVDTAASGKPAVSSRSWVVESDRLSVTPTAQPGLQQPTVPMSPVPGQNFRYLGASFDLADWHEAGGTVERLHPLTAIGYGEPAFAGFYPNSSTAFGFLDTLDDLAGYSPATSTVSYHVAGWYADSTDDPLSGGGVVSGDNRYGWTWTGTPAPTATVCSGGVTGIAWDPAAEYLGDAPQPLTVAVADTGAEALSALMASLLAGHGDPAGQIERLLNALQFGLLSNSAHVDSLPAFGEAMHGASFGAIQGGSAWSVVTEGGPKDGPEGGEVTLPDALAAELNALNVLQLRAAGLVFEAQARQRQLFADWYKYLLVRYDPDQVPSELRAQAGAVQAYLDERAQAIGAILASGGTLDVLRTSVADAAAAITAKLPAGLTLSGDTAAPPYYEPADPALVLAGADVTVAARHRPLTFGVGAPRADAAGESGSGLPCRLDSQVVSAVTLQAGLIHASSQQVVDATALPGLAVLPGQAPAVLVQTLLREAFLLSPPLQPAVAAACAALGGAGNPAVLDFAGTVSLLGAAAEQFAGGTAPAQVAYAGTAPDPVMVNAWAGTPWLPLLLQYEVAFHPMRFIDPVSGGAYPYDFVDASFTLPIDGVDLEYANGQPQGLQVYSGSTLLTGGAVADMTGEIQRFLGSTAYSDPELAGILARIQALPLLAQRLTGSVQAMLMQSLALQMPVSDPPASPPQARFAAEIAAAIGDQTSVAPLPEESFNPLRAGTLALRQVRIVDAFGRFKDYPAPTVVLSSALRPPKTLPLPAGTAFLAPRITQAARLLFRWLAASDDDVETSSHPATTPVIGWLVPNWLDRALAIYDAAGTALGALTLSADDSSALWTPAPGGPFGPAATIGTVFSGQNQHLADFAAAVYAGGAATFLAPFMAAVRDALDFTLPAGFRENAETAVLAGQPLAIARAGLGLQVPGGTAASQSWANFAARVLDRALPDDAGLTEVRFPVRLGGPHRLDDSLVGFWLPTGDSTDWLTFYAPGATQPQGGVGPPAQNTITLTPQPGAGSQCMVTLLLDPRGSVHATSGVLPVAEAAIPPDHYTSAIASLSLALATRPVLSGSSVATEMSLALPKVSSGQWSWVTVTVGQWQTASAADAVASATLNYTPQRVSEGWLVLRPDSTAPSSDGADERGNRP
jgi:hypothetical protein